MKGVLTTKDAYITKMKSKAEFGGKRRLVCLEAERKMPVEGEIEKIVDAEDITEESMHWRRRYGGDCTQRLEA